MRHARPALVLLIALSGCGGGSSPSSPASPPSTPSPQVGGSYVVSVALLDNACAQSPTVQTQPTSVAHTAGATSFTLTHGGLQVAGTVSRDGSFTTTPVAVGDAQGPATLALAGRFTTSGLEATVTVTVASAAGPCVYRVGWTGTKQGAPNVIG